MSEIKKRGTTQHLYLQLISTLSKPNRDRSNIYGGNLHDWFQNHIEALHYSLCDAARQVKGQSSHALLHGLDGVALVRS